MHYYSSHDHFGARSSLSTPFEKITFYRLTRLSELGLTHLDRLPYCIRVWLENVVRHCDDHIITQAHVERLASWDTLSTESSELPFRPSRVLLQDLTGVPALVDLATLRSAVEQLGGNPLKVNPQMPIDLVIDHSVQVDMFGSKEAFSFNIEREYERNRERYKLLRWAQDAFDNFRVVPPATGIIHQVNLEHLATVITKRKGPGSEWIAFPDTLVGTDSHTTMVNSMGVVGWGVGGIEAEAVILGEPLTLLCPEVVGVELVGELCGDANATDLALTATEILRQHNVVGKFVEFFGLGASRLSLQDRATLANMAPEYGATMGFFPVDDQTLRYLSLVGHSRKEVQLVELYTKEQELFRSSNSPTPVYSKTLTLDLSTVVPSLAGPKRPQDRVPLSEAKSAFQNALVSPEDLGGFSITEKNLERRSYIHSGDSRSATLEHGTVILAAIASCTNTANPHMMITAGLVAKKAVEKGLAVPWYVKTSLAPGSKVVTHYLKAAGLSSYLDKLGFNLVGYGCTTCIGNSGPLPEIVTQAIREADLVVTAVLSGNRNFEGRIDTHILANYLASPPLVVAYALAGTIKIDLTQDPLGCNSNDQAVFLRDIWPSSAEVEETVNSVLHTRIFKEQYTNIFEGSDAWNAIADSGSTQLYPWDQDSTYIQQPPFFVDFKLDTPSIENIYNARALAVLGDSISTDHISPAGSIDSDSPAARYLLKRGVKARDFNSYGARRGNHEVMIRGTFANVHLTNLLTPEAKGGVTRHLPSNKVMSMYDAAMRYQEEGLPLILLAGKRYGTGSSRDWAAKGVYFLGVKAVIAESYERIHLSNLVGMGILPLQFQSGENVNSLGLTGYEVFNIVGLNTGLKPRQKIKIYACREDNTNIQFSVLSRLEKPIDVKYYQNGGILQTMLRKMIQMEQP